MLGDWGRERVGIISLCLYLALAQGTGFSQSQPGPGVGALEFLLSPLNKCRGSGTCITIPFFHALQVYDTPPMAVKGPNGRDPLLDVYDVPPSVEKGLPPSNHHAVSNWQNLGPQRLPGGS